MLIFWVLVSCEKDPFPVPAPDVEDQLRMEVYPVFGEQTLKLDSIYTFANGDRIQFTDLLFYVTDLKNDTKSLLDAALFDYRVNGNLLFQTVASPSDFSNLTAFLGVDEIQNHADPTALPNSHPLNIVKAGGMHWGWNPGYIFTKVEARMDTIADGVDQFDHFLVYHTGTDDLLTDLGFSSINWQLTTNQVYRAKLQLDLNVFFNQSGNEINPRVEFVTHSSPGQIPLSTKAIQNFKAGLTLLP